MQGWRLLCLLLPEVSEEIRERHALNVDSWGISKNNVPIVIMPQILQGSQLQHRRGSQTFVPDARKGNIGLMSADQLGI